MKTLPTLRLVFNLVFAFLSIGGPWTAVHAQFGLSASPELLPWLKPGSPPPAYPSGRSHQGMANSWGQINSEQLNAVAPPMSAGWLAPTSPPSVGQAAQPENPHWDGGETNAGASSAEPAFGQAPFRIDLERYEVPETSRASYAQDLLEIPPQYSPAPGCLDCTDPRFAEASGWQWFLEPMGLIMGRNDPNRVWFSYQSNDNANEIMNGQDARTRWQGGWEMTIQKSFACDKWRLAATYWGLSQMNGEAAATHPDLVSSTLIFTDVVYADPTIPGLPQDLFFGAYEQRLWRRNEIHNVEVNLVRHRIPVEGYRLAIDWLAGVRYFRFDERLTYGSRIHEGLWAENPEWEGYLSDRIENNLIGVQLGFDLHYPISKCLAVVCTPKIGFYNNHIHNRFDAYRGDGAIFAPNPNPPVGTPVPGSYPVISSDDRFAVLSQVDARIQWDLSPRWHVFLGYRLVCVSEIGLADAQFPLYVVDIADSIAHIDSNGDLLLHGAFAGMSFAF
ncbi:MAG: BBP7 family outer membrane beta-barrel protein [Thermogutta sp.]